MATPRTEDSTPAARPTRRRQRASLQLCSLFLALTATGACSLSLDLEGPPRSVDGGEAFEPGDEGTPNDAHYADCALICPDAMRPDGAIFDAFEPGFDLGDLRDFGGLRDIGGPRPDLDPPDGQPADRGLADLGLPDAEPMYSPPDLRFESAAGLMLVDAQWDAQGLRPNGAGPGRVRSDTYRLAPGQRWQWLDHQPQLAYGTPLHGPEDAGADPSTGFAGTDVSAADAPLLLHFEEAAVVPDAFALSTGVEVVRAFYRNAVAAVTPAPFGQGVAVPGSAAVQIVPTSRAFSFGTRNFTWSLFVRTDRCPGSNNVYLGGERATADSTHLWLGCMVRQGDCAEGRGVGGTVRSSNGRQVSACGPAFDDGRWHHLAMSKRGHTPGVVTWYLDGEAVAETPPTQFGEASLSLDDSRPWFGVGDFPSGNYQAHGDVDEVAIWHRALSDAELRSLADRGLARVEIWARRCQAARCAEATEPFVRLEVGSGIQPGWRRSLLPEGDGDYVQFEVVLDRSAGAGPRVLGLRLLGDSG